MKVLLASLTMLTEQTRELTTAMVSQKVELKQAIKAQSELFNKKLKDVSGDFSK